MRLLKRKYPIVLCCLLMLTAALQAQEHPSILGSFPNEGSSDILRNAFISVKLNLPNGDLDERSVHSDHVKLYPSDHPELPIPGFITLSNKLRSLILEPFGMLEPNTSYTFEMTDGVVDMEGVPFESISFEFATGEKAYRKLITMNRPFGGKPEVGEWKEEDVSGENLSTPFLREATPGTPPPKVVEPPKLLKPERSRDELLALVLRFYGGPKLPPGFGPTVLEAPAIPPLPLAQIREVPINFEAIMSVSAAQPEDLLADAADTQQDEGPTTTVANSKTQAEEAPVSEADLNTEILDRWIMAALDDVSFESDWDAISLPRFQAPQRLASQKAPISQAVVDELLATVNQELIEEEEQAQVAMAAKAERIAARKAQLKVAREADQAAKQAFAQKTETQEKWGAVAWDDISIETPSYALTLDASAAPGEVALRELPISTAEFEALLTEANQELIEEDKQEQMALAAKATREAEQETRQMAEAEAELAVTQALTQKKETQEKWHAVVWDDISIETPATTIPLKNTPLPTQLALREAPVSKAEVEALLSEVNQSLIDENEQETITSAKLPDTAVIAAAEPETQNSKLEIQIPEPETQNSKPETQINTASLLVEETIKNADRAGKIVFPQTAIFVGEFVTVEFDLPEREFVSFVLRDIKGDVYKTEGGYVEAGPHKRAVTLEGVPPGAYEAVVETIHQKVVRKVTILD